MEQVQARFATTPDWFAEGNVMSTFIVALPFSFAIAIIVWLAESMWRSNDRLSAVVFTAVFVSFEMLVFLAYLASR